MSREPWVRDLVAAAEAARETFRLMGTPHAMLEHALAAVPPVTPRETVLGELVGVGVGGVLEGERIAYPVEVEKIDEPGRNGFRITEGGPWSFRAAKPVALWIDGRLIAWLDLDRRQKHILDGDSIAYHPPLEWVLF